MPLFNLADLLARMPRNARLLGIDPGARRIGLALSDVNRRVASPYGVLARGKLTQNAAEIAAIAAREGVGGLVIGLALDAEQNLGPRAQAARDWAYALSAATGLPAAMQDESLTTADSHEMLIGAAVSRRRRGEIIDKVAAAAILQAALDTQKNGGG
jgi:putative Holliday junction resolvase